MVVSASLRCPSRFCENAFQYSAASSLLPLSVDDAIEERQGAIPPVFVGGVLALRIPLRLALPFALPQLRFTVAQFRFAVAAAVLGEARTPADRQRHGVGRGHRRQRSGVERCRPRHLHRVGRGAHRRPRQLDRVHRVEHVRPRQLDRVHRVEHRRPGELHGVEGVEHVVGNGDRHRRRQGRRRQRPRGAGTFAGAARPRGRPPAQSRKPIQIGSSYQSMFSARPARAGAATRRGLPPMID